MKYGFIRKHQHEYPVKTMCQVVQVSVSGYYAWQHRGPSERSKANAQLSERIENVYQSNRQVYGSPRIHAVLTTQGIECGRKRVARLMRQANLSAKPVQHRTRTTDSRHGQHVADNVLGRDFSADTPNTKWYNVPKNLNTEEGGDKIHSKHDEKTVYSSIQGQSGTGTSQRREDISTTCQRL